MKITVVNIFSLNSSYNKLMTVLRIVIHKFLIVIKGVCIINSCRDLSIKKSD